ncbi:hypothetical protein BCR44DRAFT_1430932 [Catenaria anguillulae PL171]|uniref:Uncharacterized protein n=1 Tax=Catenaria anguillulae PL171 TaxID=765915 RepID=A0A1Y2HS13_9FUNG|nr:hypothetical protein BCR44DRAFT_1430932 [Catenaria anguillulae PL171]
MSIDPNMKPAHTPTPTSSDLPCESSAPPKSIPWALSPPRRPTNGLANNRSEPCASIQAAPGATCRPRE